MNDYWIAILLGVVEGLTEFLPVSSTAHIRICQSLLSMDMTSSYWKMFSVVIQLGAILAVVAYFWRKLVSFLQSFVGPLKPEQSRWRHPLVLVFISFVVTAGPCFLIDEKIGENLERLDFMAIALIVGGVLMWWVDKIYSRKFHTDGMEKMNLPQAIVIGLFQILAAAFPGTSRSMATIAGGQIMGLDRKTSLEFSFFLSIPVMVAASGFKLAQFAMNNPEPVEGKEWIALGIGFFVSFVVAFAVIAWFMAWVRRHGFGIFALYRLIAGLGLLAWIASS